MSQRALARGICTAAYVSRLEKGERIPSLQLLRRLASRLGADADELASGLPGSAHDPLLDAEVALGLGDTLEAEKLFTAALDPDDRTLRARALAGLGEIAYSIGDARGAVALLEEAAATHPQGAFAVADPLGRAYAHLSDLQAAVGVFEKALVDAEQRDDSFERIRYAVLLADVLIDSGDPQRAADVLRTVVEAGDEPDDPLARARLWRSQALLCEERGDRQTADRYARRALEAVALVNHTKYVTRAHKLLARVALDPTDVEHALELLDAIYPAVERTGDAYEIATLRIEQTRLLARLERADEAASFAREAAAALRNAQPADAAHGFALAAEVLTLLGDRTRAAELNQLASVALERSNRAARAEP